MSHVTRHNNMILEVVQKVTNDNLRLNTEEYLASMAPSFS
jgi:hypothetical protein